MAIVVDPQDDLNAANIYNSGLPSYTQTATIGANIVTEHSVYGTRYVYTWSYEQVNIHFDSIVALARARFPATLQGRSRFWVVWQNENNHHWVSYRFDTLDDYDFTWIWVRIQNILRYDDCYTVCNITVRFINCQAGSGLRTLVESKSVHGVPLFDDHLCAQRALIILDRHHAFFEIPRSERTVGQERDWRQVRTTSCNTAHVSARRLTGLALALSHDAKVDENTPSDFKDLTKMVNVIAQRRGIRCELQVFNGDMVLIFSTLSGEYPVEPVRWFDLVLDEEHYLPITKINRIFHNKRKYCRLCKKAYQSYHRCVTHCTLCGSNAKDHFKLWTDTKNPAEWKFCGDCGRKFYTDQCFEVHTAPSKGNKPSMCNSKWKCGGCKKLFFYVRPNGKPTSRGCNPDDHHCSDRWCKNCAAHVPLDHHCFMQLLKPQETSTSDYLFCDFEADQSTGTHVINLVVTQEADGKQWPLHRTVDAWVDYLLQDEGQKYGGYTVIFHNGKGYDFQFILKCLVKRAKLCSRVRPVMVGAKILYFSIAPRGGRFKQKTGIRFVDSINFLPMALKKFTKTFGLRTKKGFYPHFFNTASNISFKGVIPPRSMFGVDSMHPSVAEEFQVQKKIDPGLSGCFIFYPCCVRSGTNHVDTRNGIIGKSWLNTVKRM